jgi:hypothetical protein
VVVTMAEFKASLSGAVPAPDLNAPLSALWWAAKGGWDRAHELVSMPISIASKAISATPATGTGARRGRLPTVHWKLNGSGSPRRCSKVQAHERDEVKTD